MIRLDAYYSEEEAPDRLIVEDLACCPVAIRTTMKILLRQCDLSDEYIRFAQQPPSMRA